PFRERSGEGEQSSIYTAASAVESAGSDSGSGLRAAAFWIPIALTIAPRTSSVAPRIIAMCMDEVEASRTIATRCASAGVLRGLTAARKLGSLTFTESLEAR